MKIVRLLAGATLLLAFASIAVAHGAPGTTTLSASSNPVTLVSGTDVTFTTVTTSTGHPDKVSDGKVKIEYATDGFGNPVPAGSVVTWVALNDPGVSPDGSGMTSLAVDLDALGFVAGTVGGFRAHYVTGGGGDKVNTHFSAAVDVTAQSGCTGVEIGATLASGPGDPGPGTHTWTFKITVKNCDLSTRTFKVQGGSNGWAPMTGAVVTEGTYSVRNNNRNQVLTWTVELDPGEEQCIYVTVSGTIRPNTPDGTILFLSGAWSAAYTDDFGNPAKSDYTGRVSATVNNP